MDFFFINLQAAPKQPVQRICMVLVMLLDGMPASNVPSPNISTKLGRRSPKMIERPDETYLRSDLEHTKTVKARFWPFWGPFSGKNV